MNNRYVLKWFDGQLVWIQHEADRLGYPLDDDIGYQQVCANLADIDLGTFIPDNLDWANIGYALGCVRGKLENFKEGI